MPCRLISDHCEPAENFPSARTQKRRKTVSFFKKTPNGEKKPLSGKAKLRLVLLIVNTILFFSVYRVLLYVATTVQTLYLSYLVMIGYAALLVGFTLAYLIYNRFLYRKGLTKDDLNPAWTEEQKEAFLADGEEHLEKSKWMMLVILPLIFTFLCDALDLFIIEGVLKK